MLAMVLYCTPKAPGVVLSSTCKVTASALNIIVFFTEVHLLNVQHDRNWAFRSKEKLDASCAVPLLYPGAVICCLCQLLLSRTRCCN
jgi:hypothetical protein